MRRTRTEKAMLNIVTSTVYEIVAMVCALILPRLILIYYGSAYNGIISSISQFLSFISILSLGVTASTRVALYKTLANDDVSGTSAIIRSTEKYMQKVGVVLLGYIIILAIAYPFLVDTGFSFYEVFLLVISIGVLSFAEYFWGITYQTLLGADQSLYISNIFMTVATILNTILSTILILAGCSIQVVKFGSALVLCMKPLFQNLYVKKKYLIDKNSQPDSRALARRGDAMAHAIANIVHDKTDIIVLTIFADIKIVSVYTVYALVLNALQKIQKIFTTGVEPIFGNMWAKKELDKIAKNLSLFEYIVTVFISIAFSIAFVMMLPFVKLYTNGVTDVKYVLPAYSFVAILAAVFQGFRAPYLALVQGIGHYKETKKGAYWEAGINLILSVVLVNIVGITGVAIGTLVANVFRAFQYAIYIDSHVLPRGKKMFIKKILWTLLNIFVIALFTYNISDKYASTSILSWIICACIVGIVSIIVTVLSSYIFYKKDMEYAIKIVKRMLKGR